jgi:ribonucleoside-diphosphate reductase alpha chain
MSAMKQVIAINENEATRPKDAPTGSVSAEILGTSSELGRALRRRLPDERRAITHHFSIAGQEGYLTVGVYDDGSPAEIFVRMAKEG